MIWSKAVQEAGSSPQIPVEACVPDEGVYITLSHIILHLVISTQINCDPVTQPSMISLVQWAHRNWRSFRPVEPPKKTDALRLGLIGASNIAFVPLLFCKEDQ